MKRRTISLLAVMASVVICVFIYMFVAFSDHNSNKETEAPAAQKSDSRKRLRKIRPGEKYIVIDRYSNKLYLRTMDRVLMTANCSTGSGVVLTDKDTKRQWKFETPMGVFLVNSKLVNPWWRKPDWAFIEEDEQIPESEKDRLDPEMLGEYAMGFGNGYFIHGTIYERLLGVSVTHGCVRLGSEDLKELYNNVHSGTYIFIY